MPKRKKKLQHPHDLHAKKRFNGRYNIKYDPQVKQELLYKIRHGFSTGKRLTNTRSLHKMSYNGVDIEVIYSKRTKKIVTVLPPKDEGE